MQEKDRIFSDKLTEVSDFRFGEKVASVFDDMLDRSVPFYQEIQRMIGEMAADFAMEGTNCYDLGCSTGTTMIHLDKCIPDQVRFIGVDNSTEMLDRCRTKDRKSTRLNSSHLGISYAVFCLKKKN